VVLRSNQHGGHDFIGEACLGRDLHGNWFSAKDPSIPTVMNDEPRSITRIDPRYVHTSGCEFR
jgi:hypothetical protein